MDSDRSGRVEEVYQRVLEQTPDRRSAALERECAGDTALRRAVEARLAESDETIGWVPQELRQLGRYTLEVRLGSGGMGDVFRALDTRLGRRVAIKVVKHEFGARFEREARAISALNHRHVCTLYDVGPNFLVMELIEGETLAERIRRQPLSPEEVLRYGAQIAEALAAAHAQGIVHRDLKPGNVMIGSGGAKVLDFGLAKLTTTPFDAPTETRMAMATPAYMSPEQALGRECGSAADLFALGLVLYEMLAGALPLPGASLGSMLAAGDVSVPKPTPGRTARARKLNALILQLLAKEPAGRPASAASVAQALRAIGRRRGPGPRLLSTGVAAGVLLAAAVLWWHRTSGIETDAPLQASHVEMVTNYSGDETEPAVSPDGARVAFSWRGEQGVRLYVTALIGNEEPTQLTHPGDEPADTTADVSPAWSPDGRSIAFVRRRSATSAEIMTVPAESGTEMPLREIRLISLAGTWLAWNQSGTELAFSEASRETGRATVFALRVADGEIRALTRPPEGVSGDASPAFSPDGRSLAFERWPSPGSSTVQVQALAPDGTPDGEPVAVDAGRAPAWVGPSRLVFAADNRILERSGNGPSRQIYVSSDRLVGLAAVPRQDPTAPALVVAQRNPGGPRLWKLALERPGHAAGRPELQTRFGSGVTNPDFSPDGRHVVFASARSGTPEIWMADPDGGGLAQLTMLGLQRTGIPRWAPDSRRIAFFARMSDEPQIYVIDWTRAEDRPQQVTDDLPGCNVPTWSRDGGWIYCSRRIAGDMRLYRVKPNNNGASPQLERLFEGKDARETADGRILYIKDDRPGLFSRSLTGNPLENPEERLVDDIIGPIAYYAPTREGVYYTGQNGFGRYVSLRFFDYARRAAIDVAPRSATGAMAALTVSPDGKELLYAQQAEPGIDLALLEFR